MKVRDEIVSFGAPGELRVDERGVVGGGMRLSPEALHELVEDRGDEVVFFDARALRIGLVGGIHVGVDRVVHAEVVGLHHQVPAAPLQLLSHLASLGLSSDCLSSDCSDA